MDNDWEVKPGRIWLVPLDADGQPNGEPVDISEARGMRAEDWSWEDDRGLDGGLEGGLQGWPGGAPAHEGLGSWSMELELSPGERGDELMAALMGRSVSEYRDLVRWLKEKARLERLTGLDWSLT